MNRRKEIKLIDRATEIRLEIARLTKELESIKDTFKLEDDGVYVGNDEQAMVVSSRTSTTFSVQIAKSLLTPNQLKQCFVTKTTKVCNFITV